MQRSSELQWLEDTLINLGTQPQLKGRRFLCVCPKCAKREAYVYFPRHGDAAVLRCNRQNKCGHSEIIRSQRDHKVPKSSAGFEAKPKRHREIEVAHYPPQTEIQSLWNSFRTIDPPTLHDACELDPELEERREQARELLIAKRANPSDVAAFGLAKIPNAKSKLWPWPRYIVIPAYDHRGELRSLHGRTFDLHPDPKWKNLWPPGGFQARGLLFADANGLALLKGGLTHDDLDGILVVEGLTDFLSASLWALDLRCNTSERYAVLGVVSGSASAFAMIRWNPSWQCILATDADNAGDTYAQKIRLAMPGIKMRRMRIGRFQ